MKTFEKEARSRLLHRQAGLLGPRGAQGPLDGAELEEITAALRRMDEGRYGDCERCGAAIGRQRLMALPEVRVCIGCAEALPARVAP